MKAYVDYLRESPDELRRRDTTLSVGNAIRQIFSKKFRIFCFPRRASFFKKSWWFEYGALVNRREFFFG